MLKPLLYVLTDFISTLAGGIANVADAMPPVITSNSGGAASATVAIKLIATMKQVECLAALCHAYVEVLFGGQSAFTSE